ncbi:hypothetical protein [Motiliproteus sp.]|uniref:hypothetical protein n=1 Tax=Motiliproteus sp. TaxID=1898955 RepID=UPI003BACCEBE
MSGKPILFNAEMIRALLMGRKTQTRRPVTGTALQWLTVSGFTPGFVAAAENGLSPFGYQGHLLYVRETFNEVVDTFSGEHVRYLYAANMARNDGKTMRWKPSIHMPRQASRLTLRIGEVRIERASEISTEDAKQEGIQLDDDLQGWHLEDGRFFHAARACDSYRQLWNVLYPDQDWCWVVVFEVIQQNIDQYLEATDETI